MSARIISHRGLRVDNSTTGVLLAIAKGKFCEFDILYVEGVWKVCHDFGALTPCTANLADLLKCLGAVIVRNDIIVDVKWDWVWNRIDDPSTAVAELKKMLLNVVPMPPLWLQACDPHLLSVMNRHGFNEHWKVGMIVSSRDQFDKHKDNMEYAMIPLHELRAEDVEEMSKERELIGFTCHRPEQLPLYKHLIPFIRGIVCDVSV